MILMRNSQVLHQMENRIKSTTYVMHNLDAFRVQWPVVVGSG
jgi:hypothetical protein